MFSIKMVREITGKIHEMTEGRFLLPSISRPGDGVNIIDGNIIVSWRGPRKAVAYYLGVMAGVAGEAGLPEPFDCYRRNLSVREGRNGQTGTDAGPYSRGVEDSRYYLAD